MARLKYRLASRAVADLENIADYLGARSLSASQRVIEALLRTFGLLGGSPEMGTNLDHVRPGLRMFVPGKPAASYAVFFTRMSHGVLIVGVVHSARDWQGMFDSGER